MLLLVTLALVVASAVLLILGFIQDALGFIYLSMLCAGVAALALFVFARLARRRSAALAGAGVTVGSGPIDDKPRPKRRRGSAAPEAVVADEETAEIREPVSAVRLRTAGGGGDAPGAGDDPSPLTEWTGGAGSLDDDTGRTDDAPWRPEPDTAVQPVVAAAPSGAGTAGAPEQPWPDDDWSDWGDEVVFPIEDYDELRVAEILPLLGQLEPDELQEVRDRELSGKARASLLDRIDDRLGRAGRPAPAPAARATKATKAPAAAKAAKAAKATKTPAAAKATRAAKTTKAAKAPRARKQTPTEAPLVDAPAVEAPAVEAPLVDAPAVEAPAVEAPAVGAPAAQAPVTGTPARRSARKAAEPAPTKKAAGRRTPAATTPAATAPTAAPAVDTPPPDGADAPAAPATRKATAKKATTARTAAPRAASARKATGTGKAAPARRTAPAAPDGAASAAPAPEPATAEPATVEPPAADGAAPDQPARKAATRRAPAKKRA